MGALSPSTIGRYEVVRRLGVGGMGEVYLCRAVGAQGFEAPVVVKRVRADRVERRRYLEMFADEARLSARLAHPHVVKVFDFGEDAAGPYLAMEHVHGQDLAAALRAGPPAPPGLAAHVVRAIAHALAHAHQLRGDDGGPLGLVHRDVSPHNVLLGYAGEIKLSDFGVARAAGRLRHSTGDGLKGKLRYLAPEQAARGALDGRTDVYALGLVLWELLTGSPALQGDDEATLLDAARRGGVRPPPQTPEALQALLARCLAVDPAARPRAAEMADALDSFVLGHVSDPALLRTGTWLTERLPPGPPPTPEDRPPTPNSDAPTVGRRGRRPWLLLALLASTAGAAAFLQRSDAPRPRPTPPAAATPAAPVDGREAPTREGKASPAARRGWIDVQVRPHGQVFVDGRRRGPAPLRVSVSPGPHTVRVDNAALGLSETLRIQVKPGRISRRTVVLK